MSCRSATSTILAVAHICWTCPPPGRFRAVDKSTRSGPRRALVSLANLAPHTPSSIANGCSCARDAHAHTGTSTHTRTRTHAHTHAHVRPHAYRLQNLPTSVWFTQQGGTGDWSNTPCEAHQRWRSESVWSTRPDSSDLLGQGPEANRLTNLTGICMTGSRIDTKTCGTSLCPEPFPDPTAPQAPSTYPGIETIFSSGFHEGGGQGGIKFRSSFHIRPPFAHPHRDLLQTKPRRTDELPSTPGAPARIGSISEFCGPPLDAAAPAVRLSCFERTPSLSAAHVSLLSPRRRLPNINPIGRHAGSPSRPTPAAGIIDLALLCGHLLSAGLLTPPSTTGPRSSRPGLAPSFAVRVGG